MGLGGCARAAQPPATHATRVRWDSTGRERGATCADGLPPPGEKRSEVA